MRRFRFFAPILYFCALLAAAAIVDRCHEIKIGFVEPANATLQMVTKGPLHSSFDMETDFVARATASGVTYAHNTSDVYVAGVIQPLRAITDSTSLRNEALDCGANCNTNLVRDTTLHLSGTGSIQILVLDDAGTDSGAHWAYRLNGTDSTQFTRFYAQMAVYFPRDNLAYRYQLDSTSQPQQLKIWNLEQNGGGQIAITARRFLGFPGYFTQTASFNNSGGATVGTPNPWSQTQEWIQNAIDNGGTPSTKDEYIARYGPLQGISGDVTGSVGGQPAYDSGDPYLYNRTWPSGWPDTRAIAAGETIATAVVTATVYTGTDGMPANVISGVASINGPVVTQRVTGGGVGNIYQLKCLATTSTGQILRKGRYWAVLPTLI